MDEVAAAARRCGRVARDGAPPADAPGGRRRRPRRDGSRGTAALPTAEADGLDLLWPPSRGRRRRRRPPHRPHAAHREAPPRARPVGAVAGPPGPRRPRRRRRRARRGPARARTTTRRRRRSRRRPPPRREPDVHGVAAAVERRPLHVDSARADAARPTPTPDAHVDPHDAPHAAGIRRARLGDPDRARARRAALTDYYALLPGDLDAGWDRLTPRYQATTAANRSTYRSFWGDVERVRVADVDGSPPGTVDGDGHLRLRRRPGLRRAHAGTASSRTTAS